MFFFKPCVSRVGTLATSFAVAHHVRPRRECHCETTEPAQNLKKSTVVFNRSRSIASPARARSTQSVGRSGARLNLSSEAAKLKQDYPVAEKTIAELSEEMNSHFLTSEKLVKTYLQSIEEIDRSGPCLSSVIQVNPRAIEDARELDAERAQGEIRGPLHGIPILIKDNIETKDPMPTTAGSLALIENVTHRDAPVVARLRAAGAVVLGKTNLSEWANFRSTRGTSGWSAVGGLTRNPFALDRTAVGSSSGSAAAVAANLAVAALGTETDGSVICPAAVAGLVGLKPTVGLVSRRHIVPISHSQDTAGPMARTVQDAACLLTVMAGTDPEDAATLEADMHRKDYEAALDRDEFKGKRIGVVRLGEILANDAVKKEFERALECMRSLGAELVEIDEFHIMEDVSKNEFTVLLCEFKADINAYLANAAPAVKVRCLRDVIAFNESQAERELPYFGQEIFALSESTQGLESKDYHAALETSKRLAGAEGIDYVLRKHNLDALVAPSMTPAWTNDLVNGDHFCGAAATLPAVAGYPHLTVPMGHVLGLPVGVSFIGPAWSEQRILSLGFAFEQQTQARKQPTFPQTLAL